MFQSVGSVSRNVQSCSETSGERCICHVAKMSRVEMIGLVSGRKTMQAMQDRHPT